MKPPAPKLGISDAMLPLRSGKKGLSKRSRRRIVFVTSSGTFVITSDESTTPLIVKQLLGCRNPPLQSTLTRSGWLSLLQERLLKFSSKYTIRWQASSPLPKRGKPLMLFDDLPRY